MARITYRAKFDGDLDQTIPNANSPTQVWRTIATIAGMPTDAKQFSDTVATLKSQGWKVDRHIDLDETEELVGGVILEKVVPLGLGGALKKLLGKIF